MKAFADLKRRKISAAVAAAPLPDRDFDYPALSLGKRSRRGLHAVSPLETPSQPDSRGMNEAELARRARDSQGGISSATNLVICPAFNNNAKAKRLTSPMLTTQEFIQVRLATVRESARHCYWPADVLAKFAAADVIR
ncbi:hypothetical protein BH20ACI3_BH20ACI3_20260 [soil metagenome]